MKRIVFDSAMWGKKILVTGALFLGVSFAFAARPTAKISKDLEGKNTSDQINVIVQYKQAPTAFHHQKVLSRGGQLRQELGLIKAGSYKMPAWAVAQLANDPDVAFISLDRTLRNTGNGNPKAVLDYHAETVNLSSAQSQGLDGNNIGVAIIDSGMSPSNDFNASNIVYSQSFISGLDASDQYGHGTHVAGIIAGDGTSSAGSNYAYHFMGIAPQVNLINLRVLDQNGLGTDSAVIKAIQTAISLKNRYNIRVINLSLGRGVYESYKNDPLCQAAEQAWNAGIVVVVAAGNGGRNNAAGTGGYGTITAPANDPYVITVGAMNTRGTKSRTDDVPASYSSKGPTLWDQVAKPDLVAPGNLVISLYNPSLVLSQELPGNDIPDSLYKVKGTTTASSTYFMLSGTSMAAPMVAGTAALMLQQTPWMTPDQVKARLMQTAYKGLQTASTATDAVTGQVYHMQADLFTVGAGYLDIQAALGSNIFSLFRPVNSLSPTVTVDKQGNVALVASNSVAWGTSATNTYGSSVLWGSNTQGQSVLWGSSSLVSQSVLWGSSTLNSTSVLWGSSVLWGNASGNGKASTISDNPK